MQNYRVNDDEIALIQGFRLLTARQREAILRAVIGVISSPTLPQLRIVPALKVVPLARKS